MITSGGNANNNILRETLGKDRRMMYMKYMYVAAAIRDADLIPREEIKKVTTDKEIRK